jgi:ABC-type Fe3+-hydroxamate transport system substrate-binding protein
MTALADDLGHPVLLSGRPARVVSLVPSITESLAATVPDLLVGATDWCTHPAGLEVTRVRGTKNPDLAAIASLEPDLVVANKEENRELDVRRLRDRGIEVWVTVTETVDQAIGSLDRLFAEVFDERPDWLAAARAEWVPPAHGESREQRGNAAVAIWRDPWMVVGRDTFTGDLLRLLGLRNVFGDAADRYPATTPEEIEARRPEVVLLPDEPYVFTAHDGPEAFAGRTALVSGRLLTWYGPSLVGAREALLRGIGEPP